MLPRLRELLAEMAPGEQVRLRRVESPEAAQAERCLGSPTIRVDGRDVEPGADQRTDFGLKSRLYATPDGLRGQPLEALVRAALAPGARHPLADRADSPVADRG
ncbi:MAG: DUF2703 domain-containing protein [Actinomycetota bacterium]|nr:DUF2703 domain-containing protein [Actinomycetota bacterium]